MWNENYRSNFDYPRLAWDLGFSFDCHNTQATLDRGKLNLIDIDKILVDRDIATVERNIPLVVQFKLDPEQIKILDPNFVKIFRLSQLSVEYLIFCKKYLDNTVVLIRNDITKITNENNGLHLQIEELTKELNELRNQIKQLETASLPENITAYKCEQCSKVFATEDYLFAHIRRRHDIKQTPSLTYQEETNKLQLEIKELKERLNSSEKYVQNHLGNAIKDQTKNEDGMSKVNELELKFDNFKALVETELKLFETHRNFQEKYEKLIELSLKNMKSDKNVGDHYIFEMIEKKVGNDSIVESKSEKNVGDCTVIEARSEKNVGDYSIVEAKSEKNVGDCSIFDTREDKEVVEQKTSATQTEDTSTTVLYSSKISNDGFDSIKPSKSEIFSVSSIQDKASDSTCVKLEKVESAIEETLRGSLEKIDNHIDSFLVKLHEIQSVKISSALEMIGQMGEDEKVQNVTSARDTKSSPDLFVNNLESTLAKTNKKKMEIASDSVISKPGSKCEKDLHKKLETIKQIRKRKEAMEKPEEETDVKPDLELRTSNVDLSLRQPLSHKNIVFKLSSKELMQQEVVKKMNNFLIEIGVSPNWTKLPERSYLQALDAVRYQSSVAKRNIPTYTKIRQKLANQVKKEAQPRVKKVQSVSTEIMLRNIKTPVGGRGECSRRSSADDCDIISEKFHQKNMMYSSDTDSEIDFIFKGKEGYSPAGNSFSAVVQELKGAKRKSPQDSSANEDGSSLQSHKSAENPFENRKPSVMLKPGSLEVPEPSDTSSEELEPDDPKYQFKSALRHHPLPEMVTKKVVFDLDKSEGKKGRNSTVKVSDDDSTTSLGSLLLNDSNNDFEKKKSGKGPKSSDISDWDLSDE